MKELPPWVVLHVPHDSTEIPENIKSQFILDDSKLSAEILRMTDHHTLALFSAESSGDSIVRAPVSRLVVDVERFADDKQEPMHERGMGVVYTKSSGMSALRRSISAEEREILIQKYYNPHHKKLEDLVEAALEVHDRCLVIDCHSFPSIALPYELADPLASRPDICIGTDDFHSDRKFADTIAKKFTSSGWKTSFNDPFSGALVPISKYHCDPRVSAIMLEVNRRLYVNETNAEKLPEFENIRKKIREAFVIAISEHYI